MRRKVMVVQKQQNRRVVCRARPSHRGTQQCTKYQHTFPIFPFFSRSYCYLFCRVGLLAAVFDPSMRFQQYGGGLIVATLASIVAVAPSSPEPSSHHHRHCRLYRTLFGHYMVLQRAPTSAIVWCHSSKPGATITTSITFNHGEMSRYPVRHL